VDKKGKLLLALEHYRSGGLLIVTDDESRENEGDLVARADLITPERTAFMVRHTTGILCVAMTELSAKRLDLPRMLEQNEDQRATAFTVSVDLRVGITTGVSALERTQTIHALADESATPKTFARPGHIFPLIAHRDLLEGRKGHTEAGVVLSLLTKAPAFAVLAELVNDDGTMTRGRELREFAEAHHIPIISVEQLVELSRERGVKAPVENPKISWTELPAHDGNWQIATFDALKYREHVILKYGSGINPKIRIHSECFTGDVLGSQRCDCGEQLGISRRIIKEHGSGYLVYLRDHEGRAIGLDKKLQAYQLQDKGLDTVEANLSLGLPIDGREWADAIDILKALQVHDFTLLTNNPEKAAHLIEAGFSVEIEPIEVTINAANKRYLQTKAERLGHLRKVE
jgi:3,4-dihydroxy 2-butanone 4-phosphate synthase/GTP cyclohydrolase II